MNRDNNVTIYRHTLVWMSSIHFCVWNNDEARDTDWWDMRSYHFHWISWLLVVCEWRTDKGYFLNFSLVCMSMKNSKRARERERAHEWLDYTNTISWSCHVISVRMSTEQEHLIFCMCICMCFRMENEEIYSRVRSG